MKILITGGSGFIGANLAERLLIESHEVVCLDNFYSSSSRNIENLKKFEKFSFVEHDIINPLPAALGRFDEIYHLACPASPPRYQKDHIYTLRVNFEGTLNVLNFAKENGWPKFLFSSTSEVYGNPLESPQKESYFGNVNPNGLRSCYDEGKRVAESLVFNFWREYKFPLKVVRIFNTYGPKMDPYDGRVVSNFIVQALKGENLTIYGDGKQTRSFQYIDDLVAGMIKYMAFNEDFPRPINLGNPNEITVLELAEIVAGSFGNLKLEFLPLPSDDPMRRCPDISLAKEKLQWEPVFHLKDGLIKTIEYFKTCDLN